MAIIQSRHHPFVKRCRQIARRRDESSGEILLDGLHLLQEALAARLRGLTVAVESGARSQPDVARAIHLAEQSDATVHEVTADVLDAASPVQSPSGVITIAEFHLPAVESVLRSKPALVVLAVDIQDPGNIGAIIRAAEAAGATGVVVAGECADPLGWRALRGSMGSVLRLPVAAADSAAIVLAAAREQHIFTMAATPVAGDSLFDADLSRSLMLVVGAEGKGLDESTVAACDCRVRIPMASPVESLNVAVAAGVMLFEARRQRQSKRVS